jgi:transaldolase
MEARMTHNPEHDPLGDLSAAGVAVWLDDLSRELLAGGGLESLVATRHVVGVTTNPTIFAAALSKGDRYDDQLADLADLHADVDTAVFTVTTDDVRAACDVLAPVHAQTAGLDGCVSIEVDPRLSRDAATTAEMARLLWATVNRANLYIKIPATQEGLAAITEAISQGISVNVTLIFSLDRYRAVMDAYLSGLEQAHTAGRDLASIRSVASFFISRVDTEVDARLDQLGTPAAVALKGSAAIANARLAYQAYEQLTATERWQRLARLGARAQRPLWASTGVKNPAYPDTMYVAGLIARGTVNTMPGATLEAFADHGEVTGDTVTSGYAASRRVLDQLAAAGVDFEDVTDCLERDGLAKFEKSWSELGATVAAELGHQRTRSLGVVRHPGAGPWPFRGPVGQGRQVGRADLLDPFPEVPQAPVLNADRWQHSDIDRARIEGGRVSARHGLGVPDHDRNNRQPGRHGDQEGALLEWADRLGVKPRSFGGDQHGQPLAGGRLKGLEAGGRSRVTAIDERHVEQLPELAEHMAAHELLRGHPGPVVLHQRGHEEQVDVGAEIEQEDGGTPLGQVLDADHVQLDAAQREDRPRPEPSEKVEPGPSVAVCQPDADRGDGQRAERADASQPTGHPNRAAAAPAAEPHDGPAAADRDLGQPGSRVNRSRPADQAHQAEVFVAVGVEVTRPQVNPMIGGELTHAARLSRAPHHGLLDLAGQYPAPVGGEPVAHDVLNAEKARHRCDLIGQRRRAQHDRVAPTLMSPDQLAHFRVDQIRHRLLEDAVSHLIDLSLRPPLDRAGAALDQGLERAPSEAELHRELDDGEKLDHPEVPAAHAVSCLGGGGIAGDQRPVQVEECADARAFRARIDFRRGPRERRRQLGAVLVCASHAVSPTLAAPAAAARPARPPPSAAWSIP